MFDIVFRDVCLILLFFVATDVYTFFTKSDKIICKLNVHNEVGGGSTTL